MKAREGLPMLLTIRLRWGETMKAGVIPILLCSFYFVVPSAADEHSKANHTNSTVSHQPKGIPTTGIKSRRGPEKPDIESILSDMKRDGSSFDSGKLREMGKEGLSALLDHLLPRTKRLSMSRKDVLVLIRKLGDSKWKTRKLATRQLIEYGRPFKALIRKATHDNDLEVRLRAEHVLSTWEKAGHKSLEPYAKAFEVYLSGMTDKECLLELARRTCFVLQKGKTREDERKLLGHCLAVFTRLNDDTYWDILTPILDNEDDDSVAWVINHLGGSCSRRYRRFPPLLIKALASNREAVVAEALSWVPDCPFMQEWRRPSDPERIKSFVTKIFEGKNERLKFKACFPMMHTYRDPRAIEYLLSQVRSADKTRARTAIAWIGDSCNFGHRASPRLIKTLAPLLRLKDKDLRRAAAEALGTYSGTEVVRNLIPLLADKEAIIASGVAHALLEQKDKDMLKRLLRDAQKNATNALVRDKSRGLLEKLGSR